MILFFIFQENFLRPLVMELYIDSGLNTVGFFLLTKKFLVSLTILSSEIIKLPIQILLTKFVIMHLTFFWAIIILNYGKIISIQDSQN